MSNEQKLCHELLNKLTVINGECELLTGDECWGANERLRIIFDTSAFMVQLIQDYQQQTVREREYVFAV